MNSAIKKLAIIPARGGSKRLPRKNILPFSDKPMLAWTIEAAIESDVFEQVLVSTDDEEIASIAEKSNASVLMRPEEVSNDAATLIDVIHHTLKNGYSEIKQLCLLLANCPLRDARDIRNSSKRFNERHPAALLSIVNYEWTSPFRALDYKDHRLCPVFDDWIKEKSQLYPHVVCPTGAIYWSTPNALKDQNSLYVDGLEGFPITWHHGIDIDTPEDFALAACIRHSIDNGYRFGEDEC